MKYSFLTPSGKQVINYDNFLAFLDAINLHLKNILKMKTDY